MYTKILLIEYPAIEEYNAIAKDSKFNSIFTIYAQLYVKFYIQSDNPPNISELEKIDEQRKSFSDAGSWFSSLDHRMLHLLQAFVHVSFYYQKEQERLKQLDTSNINIYLSYQQQFHYHVDIYYIKLFSVLDNIVAA